jgi:hypothetical protein
MEKFFDFAASFVGEVMLERLMRSLGNSPGGFVLRSGIGLDADKRG